MSQICPNLGDPKIRVEFEEISETIGENFAYLIWNKNQGIPLDKSVYKKDKEQKVGNSQLFVALEKSLGSRKQAILGSALTFVDSFQTKNPKFDKLTIPQKVSAIQTYLSEESKFTLEQIVNKQNLQRSVMLEAERIRAMNEQPITRENYRKIGEDAKQVQNRLTTTARDRFDAYVWFRDSGLGEFVGFINMFNVANLNAPAFAQWTRNAITLFKGSDYTDLYHEAWHEFVERYLTAPQKIALYSTVRKREGGVIVNEVTISYHKLTNRQIDEILAEEFREYVLEEQRAAREFKPSTQGKDTSKGMFAKIWKTLKFLFGQQDPETVNSVTLEANELFKNLYTGELKDYTPSKENIQNDILFRSSDFEIELSNPDGTRDTLSFDAIYGHEILGAVDYLFAKELDKRKQSYEFLNDLKNKEKTIKEVYAAVRDNLSAYYAEAKLALQGIENDPKLDAQSKQDLVDYYDNKIAYLSWAYIGFDQVIAKHQEMSKGGVFNTEAAAYDLDEILDETSEENQVRDTSVYGDRSLVNPLDLAEPEIIELIKSLPELLNEIDEDGNNLIYLSPNLGLPQVGNFHKNKNMIQNKLNGLKSYDQIIEKLNELAQIAPQIKYLLARLPKPGVMSANELTLKNKFMQFVSMPYVPAIQVKSEVISTGKKGEETLNSNVFFSDMSSENKVLEFFDEEFQTKERKYRVNPKDSTGFFTFSLMQALEEYPASALVKPSQQYAFLRDAFGIDLIQDGTPYALVFDNSGNVNTLKSSKLHTSTRQKAVKLAVDHARNKMVLFQLINSSSDTELKKLVSQEITNPMSWFVSDIPKKLNEKILKLDNANPIKIEYKKMFGKSYTINNERKQLFFYIESFYNLVNSMSHLNPEDNLEYGVREWNHMIDTLIDINSVDNVNQLTGNLSPGNKFISRSLIFNTMFNSDGERRTRFDGTGIEFNMYNFSGMSVGAKGKKTTNLTGDDKLIQDFLGWFNGGYIENARTGSKSTSNGIRLNQGSNYFPINTFFPQEAAESEEKVIFAPEFLEQMGNYFLYEVERMYEDREQKTAKERRGSEFIIFRDIIKDYPQIREQVSQLLATTTPENFKKDLRKLISGKGIGRELDTAIEEYFTAVTSNYKNALVEVLAEGRSEDLPKKLKQLFPRATNYTPEDIEAMVRHFITNYYVHQVEVIHIIYGDVSNFSVKGKDFAEDNFREVFKRLGAAISPGKQPHIDKSDLVSRNSNSQLSRQLELELTGQAREYDENFNYVQYQDVNSFNPLFDKNKPKGEQEELGQLQSELQTMYKEVQIESYAVNLAARDGKTLITKNRQKYIDRAEQEIGKNLEDLFESNDKESDAQAIANLDFYRFYSDLISEWTPYQEQAYQTEVQIFKLIKQYREAKGKAKEDLKGQIETLKEQANINPLPSLKLGYWGSPVENTKYVALGKYSVSPLLPSAVFGTDLEDQMFEMLKSGTDFITFDSGSKMSLPVESILLYKKDGDNLRINSIEQENIVKFPVKGLRRQQYIAPKFKGEATLSTQLVKLIFSNFYIDGEISPEFAQLGDMINQLQNDFINSTELIVTAEKAKIFNKLNAKFQDGKLVSFDKAAFKEWIFKEFDKKGVASNVYDYFKVSEVGNEFVLPIEGSPQRSLIESVIASAISKKILKPKLRGEAYIQTASTAHSKLGTRQFLKPTKSQIRKYGINGLRDYRVENGKTQPADIKIAFQAKKHQGLLKLDWNGAPIGDLRRLNEALLDDAWVEQHTDKLRIVGVRIPVQGFNSMEYFRVREFLPENAGAVIIVPFGITTKSGSDFDIDKLFMYEPTLDSETGQLISSNLANQVVNGQASADNLTSLTNKLRHWKNLKNQFPEFQEYKEIQKEVTTFKKILAELNTLTNADDENIKDEIENVSLRLKLLRQRLFDSLNVYIDGENTPTKLKNLLDYVDKLQEFSQELKTGKVKSVATNNLIDTMARVLSTAELFSAFTKKNDSTILKGLSDEYNALSSASKITSSSIFSPLTSIRIFVENTIGKKSLGVDAKVNALHKLFQQTGLRLNLDLSSGYLLPSNKRNGEIILGGKKDAAGRHLISDIINEFINGHVDIEKEDWINAFNADKVRTPIILQMVLNGTPIETALMLVNQPVIQYFVRDTQRGQIKKVLNGNKDANKVYTEILLKAESIFKLPLVRDKFGKVLIGASFSEYLREPYFGDHIKNLASKEAISGHEYSVYTRTDREEFKKIVNDAEMQKTPEARAKLAAQIAFLSQYFVTSEQNKVVREFTAAIDFNTSSYRTVNDFYSVDKAIFDAYESFNADGIDKIIGRSVVSPFNLTQTSLQFYNQVFDFTGNPVYQDMVQTFVERNGTYWTDDQKTTEVNRLTNNFVLYILHNYEPELYKDYRNTDWFKSSATGNLKSRYFALQNSKDPQVKKFFNSNAVLNNSKFMDVKGMPGYFYPALATAEKDADTVSAFNYAFKEGLAYNKSDNEVSQEVKDYFEILGSVITFSQGYNIKFKSMQPIIPIESLQIRDLKQHLEDFSNLDNVGERLNEFRKMHEKYNSFKATPTQRYFPDFKVEEGTPVPTEGTNEDNPFVPQDEDTDSTEVTKEENNELEGIGSTARENLPLKKKSLDKTDNNLDVVVIGCNQ